MSCDSIPGLSYVGQLRVSTKSGEATESLSDIGSSVNGDSFVPRHSGMADFVDWWLRYQVAYVEVVPRRVRQGGSVPC